MNTHGAANSKANAAVSRLQNVTPIAIKRVRSQLSGEPSKGHADRCIHQREHRGDQAQLCIVQPELHANGLAQRAGNLPIEEVHQVDAEQDCQREPRILLLFGHETPY